MGLGRLVVLSALPSSGKSTVAAHLRDKHGFHHIERDALRMDFFGKDYKELSSDPDFNEKEAFLWRVIPAYATPLLLVGSDVVIDASANQHDARMHYLYTLSYGHSFIDGASVDASVNADRYLITITADAAVRETRDRARGREGSLEMGKLIHPLDPTPVLPGLTVLSYTNNTTTDLSNMLQDIDRAFGRH